MFGFATPVIVVLAAMAGLFTALLDKGVPLVQAAALTLFSAAGAAGIAGYALPVTAIMARVGVTVTVLCMVLFTLDPGLPAPVTASATLLTAFVCAAIVRWTTGGPGPSDPPKRKGRKAPLVSRKA